MHHIFSYAFRPLFFLAAVYAIAGVGWWALAWNGVVPMPGGFSNPVFWHAHEMVFGFVGAAIGGFALTAVANWTGRPPVSGMAVVALCVFWICARLLALGSDSSTLLPLAVADLGYNVLLWGLLAREIIAGGNKRNLVLLLVLGLFTACNAYFYFTEWQQSGSGRSAVLAGLLLVILLINLIGGRIVPAFTGNWLAMQARMQQREAPQRPPAFGPIDKLATLATLAFALVFLWRESGAVTAVLGFIAAACQLLRWSRWRFYQTLSDPMVWILHVAYLWIPVGLALLGASALGSVPVSSGIHAFTTGAATSMIIAVSSRAALGHSNRPLANHPLLTACYISITLTAILRVVASVFPGDGSIMIAASIGWIIALGLFAWRYTPILLGPPAPDANDLLAKHNV